LCCCCCCFFFCLLSFLFVFHLSSDAQVLSLPLQLPTRAQEIDGALAPSCSAMAVWSSRERR
jgi:hypothetical protein